LHFCWLFLSQQGLWALPNPHVTFGCCFIDCFLVNSSCGVFTSTCYLWKVFQWWFSSWHRLRFRWPFLSQQGLRALLNPCVTFGSCFIDFFWVNSGCEHFHIQASPLEGVSVTISHPAPTPFSLTFSKSRGLPALLNTRVTFERCFVDDFWGGSDLVFVDYFWVNKGCGRWRKHASPL